MSIKEGSHSGSLDDVYDVYPNGVGEMPPDGIVPGVRRIISVPGLKSREGFRRAITKGAIRGVINSLHDQGKHVAASWSAHEVTLFVAKHRTALIATAATLGTIAAGAIYLTRRSPRKK